MLLPAIILTTLALVSYTIGVWSERVQKVLKLRNAIFFGLGRAADASGTFLMNMIAVENWAEPLEPADGGDRGDRDRSHGGAYRVGNRRAYSQSRNREK